MWVHLLSVDVNALKLTGIFFFSFTKTFSVWQLFFDHRSLFFPLCIFFKFLLVQSFPLVVDLKLYKNCHPLVIIFVSGLKCLIKSS
uniref:Uncharacterized protein n=1 Tax=Anguilla anguilla TaxID=7936 RepID=A0A0E9XC44_ANGAN